MTNLTEPIQPLRGAQQLPAIPCYFRTHTDAPPQAEKGPVVRRRAAMRQGTARSLRAAVARHTQTPDQSKPDQRIMRGVEWEQR